MPLLVDLPNELLLSITEQLKLERDINAFSQTNCRVYNLLNPYLYRYTVKAFGSSVLLWAAQHGHERTAQNLLREGANVQVTTDHGQTPLLIATRNGHEAVAKLLLAMDGVDPDPKDSMVYKGRTPL